VDDFSTEYGCNTMSVEVVRSLEEAVAHVNRWGSGHTECIITENKSSAERFLQQVLQILSIWYMVYGSCIV
jgi:glutamate-5-semialdehyde dehydrogenase